MSSSANSFATPCCSAPCRSVPCFVASYGADVGGGIAALRSHRSRSVLSPVVAPRARRRVAITAAAPSSLNPRQGTQRVAAPGAAALRPLRDPPPRFNTYDPSDVEAIRVRHVRVDTRELAEAALAAVRRGDTTLAALAGELSTCAASRGRSGDLGWWDAGEAVPMDVEQFGMSDALLGAAIRTRPNAVELVETGEGWHLFVVEDVRHRLRVVRREAAFASRRKRRRAEPEFESPVPKSFHIQSLGCQMNQADKERMMSSLQLQGYHWVDDEYRSSVLVLNTCSIRAHAEEKVYSALGRHAMRKHALPGKVTLCVAGCVAQQEGEALLRRVPELDLVLGPQYAGRLGELLADVEENQCQVCATQPVHINEDLSKPVRESSTTAWVNIIYGCNERCTYCVVPAVRGLEQSRTMESIRAEIVDVAASGRREVCLLGQNVDAYGRDLQPRQTLADLLRFVHDVEGIERIRFTTGHPRYISSRLIETCAELSNVCEHFHIPPQSGDDDILKSMSRGYTADRYRAICASIREKIPDASVSGDMIVGMPGETEAQFQASVQLLRDCALDQLNTAAYSPRPNTPAATWENQVAEPVKADRLARLNLIATEVAMERSKRYLGRTEEILVESVNPKDSSQVMGRTRTNKICRLDGAISDLENKLVVVTIVGVTPYSLVGERVPGSPIL